MFPIFAPSSDTHRIQNAKKYTICFYFLTICNTLLPSVSKINFWYPFLPHFRYFSIFYPISNNLLPPLQIPFITIWRYPFYFDWGCSRKFPPSGYFLPLLPPPPFPPTMFRMVPKALKFISYLDLGRLSLSIFSLLAFSLAASILVVIANAGAIMHTHQHPRNIQTICTHISIHATSKLLLTQQRNNEVLNQ